MTETRFRIRQGGQTVAAANCETTILRLANQYRRDGEITIQYYTGTKWKRFALFCQWPQDESVFDQSIAPRLDRAVGR